VEAPVESIKIGVLASSQLTAASILVAAAAMAATKRL